MEEALPQQTPHVNLKSLFIRAGAGAGKTTQLIRSFGEFVQEFRLAHGRFPKIVITTFTRKATQEVKERLLVNALKNSNREVFEYINKKSSVHISTIHGLLSLFLTQNSEALSLPHDIKIVDQNQSDRALRKSIHSLMKKKNVYAELLESYPFYRLVEISREALDLKYQNKDLKFVLAKDLENLTEEKIKDVLKDLKSIFQTVSEVPEKWQEYFQFLKSYQSLLNESHVDEAILLFEDEPKKPSFLSKKPPFEVAAHDLIEGLRKEKVFTVQDTQSYRELHEKLNSLFLQFLEDLFQLDKAYKRKTGELTISDLENYSLTLIQDAPSVAQEFSNSWDFFMIDEYQDTSPLQVKILNAIVGDKPCFIVGDPQQSIYLFRGARSEVFNEKEEDFKRKNIEIKVLNTNYRSDPPLMNFVNDFFTPFTQSFKPMNVKEASSASKIEEQVFFLKTHDQAKGVLKHIRFLLEKGVAAQDICVLSRRNSDLQDIAYLAYQYHIPVQLQAAGGFESKREILDLVAFLKFLINPFDSENLITLIRSPWILVEDQQIVDLVHKNQNAFSLWSQLRQLDHAQVGRLKDSLDQYQELGAALTLKKFVLDSGFLAFSELIDPTGKREANIWKFLTSLTAAEKRPGFSLSLFIEDQFTALQTDLGSSSGEAQPVIQPDKVSLMTVHASKGLEFKHVIVIGLTDRPQQTKVLNLAFDPTQSLISLAPYVEAESKLVPSHWAIRVRKEFNQREILESERVLYVAMTRAQQSISLVARVARPDEKFPIFNESWFRKINWPAESGVVNTYRLRAEFYDEKLDLHGLKEIESLKPRSKKFEDAAHDIERHSVTEMLALQNAPSSQSAGPKNFEYNMKALKKAQRGTDLHRLFESLKYIDFDELKSRLNSEELALVQYLFEQKEMNLKEILKQGHNEWGFGVKLKDQVLQGQIDAWAELDQEIHILDYKTGSPEYSEKAFEQLALYTHALLKMKKISSSKKIIHSVIYPVDRKIIQNQFRDAAEFEAKHQALGQMFRS